MKEFFEFAVVLAEAAGERTQRYFGKPIEVEAKDDESPVTIADRTTEEYLRAEIERRFPDDGILGEEFGEKPGNSGRRWILDPIDGTKSFIRGVPLYGTMIALERDGFSELGVIRFPAIGYTLGAWTGGGCWLNGQRCRVSETSHLREAMAVITDFKRLAEYRGRDVLLRFINETRMQRTWGDCYGYLMVATGKAELMFDPFVHVHDFMPMLPILSEAGGNLTNLEGEPPTDSNPVLATNGRLHEAALALFRD